MNIDKYIKSLKSLNPNREELTKQNLEEELIQLWENAFTIVPIKIISDGLDEYHPIVSLIKNYDTTKFNVFSFRFLESIQTAQKYLLFAEYEADSLAIHEPSGEVFMIAYYDLLIPLGIEEGEEEEISYLTPASINQESFLEGLYHAVELSSLSLKGKIDLRKNIDVRKEYASKAIEKAGGSKYEQFWCTLLDC